MRATRVLLLLFLIAILAAGLSDPSWWPGGDNRWSSEPVYPDPHRIPLIDDVGGNAWYRGNRDAAIREWNACGPVRLVLRDQAPFTAGTITIFLDPPGGQEPAYGGWNGTAGIVALGGGWTRSAQVIAHELGHALGFGHAGRGSIMGSAAHVAPIDCQGLRSYY